MTNRTADRLLAGLVMLQQNNITLPARVGYAIEKNIRLLKTDLTEFIEIKNDAIKKFGIQKDETGWQIPVEDTKAIASFEEAIKDVADLEIKVELCKIQEAWFGNDNMPTVIFSLLGDILE